MASKTDSRPQTAFQQYLNQKKNGDRQDTQSSSTIQALESPPQVHITPTPSMVRAQRTLRPSTAQSSTIINALPPKQTPDKIRQALAQSSPTLPVQGLTSTSINVPTKTVCSKPVSPTLNTQLGSSYGDLVAAASNLATVAKQITQTPTDPGVTRSYEVLAQAATDLAASIRSSVTPKPSKEISASLTTQSLVSQSKPPPTLQAPKRMASQPATPSPLLEASAGLLKSYPSSARSRLSSSSGRRVGTPKFPQYNPIIHLRQSELAPPGTATPSRPYTANPITHVMDTAPGTAYSPMGSRGGRGSRAGRLTPGGSDQGYLGERQGEGEADILELDKADKNRHMTHMYMKYPGRVRLGDWPPKTADRISESDIRADDVALKYNDALNFLKERIESRGYKAVAQMFALHDLDKSGALDPQEFKNALASMQVLRMCDADTLDMLVDAVDADDNGKINYSEFIAALRFNKLAYKPYDPRLKHRTGGDPEQPFGPPTLRHPFGIMSDADDNLKEFDAKFESMYTDMASAFQTMDINKDGFISFQEFKVALEHINERHGLQLSDEDIRETFMQADYDYSDGISYDEFLKSFADTSGRRFLPEFMKPKVLRCSLIGHPWEWRPRNR